jgi:hypothetical protein
MHHAFAKALKRIFLLLLADKREEILVYAVARSALTGVVENYIQPADLWYRFALEGEILAFLPIATFDRQQLFLGSLRSGNHGVRPEFLPQQLPAFAPHRPVNFLLIDELIASALLAVLI